MVLNKDRYETYRKKYFDNNHWKFTCIHCDHIFYGPYISVTGCGSHYFYCEECDKFNAISFDDPDFDKYVLWIGKEK